MGPEFLQINGKEVPKSGKFQIEDREFKWNLNVSDKRSVQGHHLILDLEPADQKLSFEEWEILLGFAARKAREMFDDFRMVTNFGKRASTRTDFHVHIISPAEGEVLTKVVANFPRVLAEAQEKFDLSPEAIGFILKQTMQKK